MLMTRMNTSCFIKSSVINDGHCIFTKHTLDRNFKMKIMIPDLIKEKLFQTRNYEILKYYNDNLMGKYAHSYHIYISIYCFEWNIPFTTLNQLFFDILNSGYFSIVAVFLTQTFVPYYCTRAFV